MDRRAGFSLLELMVTLTVLAIFLGIGVPLMQNISEKRQTVAAAEHIYSQLQFARSEAISRSEVVHMNFSPGADWAVGISNDANCDPADNDPECTLMDMENNNPITHRFTAADFENINVTPTVNQISFQPQRGTAAVNAGINIASTSNIGYRINVNVGILGQISICSPDDDPAKYVPYYRPCS